MSHRSLITKHTPKARLIRPKETKRETCPLLTPTHAPAASSRQYFFLLRRDALEAEDGFNYSTLTVWDSEVRESGRMSARQPAPSRPLEREQPSVS